VSVPGTSILVELNMNHFITEVKTWVPISAHPKPYSFAWALMSN